MADELQGWTFEGEKGGAASKPPAPIEKPNTGDLAGWSFEGEGKLADRLSPAPAAPATPPTPPAPQPETRRFTGPIQPPPGAEDTGLPGVPIFGANVQKVPLFDEPQNGPASINEKTGLPRQEPGYGAVPILDAPIRGSQRIVQGSLGLRDAFRLSAESGAYAQGDEGKPYDPKKADAMKEQARRQAAEGLGGVLSGALELYSPALVSHIAMAPVESALHLGAGVAGQQVTEKTLTAAGVPQEYAGLAGDLVLLTGVYGGVQRAKAKVDSVLGEHNAVADRLLAKERSGGQVAELTDDIFRGESYPVKIGEQKVTVEYQGASRTNGRGFWRVVDETGKPLHAGTGEDVQGWLRTQGAVPQAGEAAPESPAAERATARNPETARLVEQARPEPGGTPERTIEPKTSENEQAIRETVDEAKQRLEDIRAMQEHLTSGQDVEMGALTMEHTSPEERRSMLADNVRAHQQIYDELWEQLGKDIGTEHAAQLKAAVEQPQDVGESRPPQAQQVVGEPRPFPTAQTATPQTAGVPFETPQPRMPQGPKAVGTMPAANKEEKPGTGLAELGGAAQAIGENMRSMLWDKAQKGDVNEAGQPSAILQAAKMARDAGGLQDREQFDQFAEDFAQIPRNKDFQANMRGLVQRYTPEKSPELAGWKFEGEPTAVSNGHTPIAAGAEEFAAGKPTIPAGPRAAKPAEEPKHDYSSTQTNLPEHVAEPMRQFARAIPDDKLAEDGRESEPHITVKYGLHDEDPTAVQNLLKDEPPITATLGKASLFSNDDADVLKVDIDSPDLHRLNAKIAALPNGDTHPTYKPHATIAYLKPGEGKKYDGKEIPGVTGQKVTLPSVTFSGKNGDKVEIPLKPASNDTAQPTNVQQSAATSERGPGWVGNIPTSEIQVDPSRFQFKANVGQGGAGEELRGVTKWDPEKAGVTAVWRDPENGKTYVVNGHHRVELAQRTGAPEMTVRYLDARNAKEARLKGALINIAEGRGESTDAARVFRDSGMTPEQLAAEGVSLKGKIASEGLALSNLAQPIFDDVISGDLPASRGAVIGANVPNHADQKALYDLIQQRERNGKRLTNDQIGELVRLNERTSTKTEEQHGLFGVQEMTRSLLPEKAEVSDYIRKQINAERKLFGTVSTQAAAEKLGESGNVIRVGENAEVAQRANQGSTLYDKLSTKSGPIDDILDRAARELADGKPEAKQRAYREVRNVLSAQVRKLTGIPQGDGRGVEGLGGEGPRGVSGGERNPSEAELEGPIYSRRSPGFYSQLQRTIEDKMPGSATPEQVSGIVRNPQNAVKADELKWTGLDDWLKEQKGPVSKKQVLDFLKQNEVQVEEVTHGPDPDIQRSINAVTARISQHKARQLEIAEEIERVLRSQKSAPLEWAQEETHPKSKDRPWWSARGWNVYYRPKTKDYELYNVDGRETVGFFESLGEAQNFADRHRSLIEVVPDYESDRRPDRAMSLGEAVREAYGMRSDGGAPRWMNASVLPAVKRAIPLDLAQRYDAEVREKFQAQETLANLTERETRTEPKFKQHTLPGGENYRELLLTLPQKLQANPALLGTERELSEIASKMHTLEAELGGPGVLRSNEYGHLAERYDRLDANLQRLREAEAERSNYTSPHWSEPNVLAHIRFNDRTGPDGEKILHVEEIQSDWHQAGKRKGYREPAPPITLDKIERADDQWRVSFSDGSTGHVGYGTVGANATPGEIRQYYRRILADKNEAQRSTQSKAVPPAPFSKTWQELAFRRVLRYAAEHGYDKVTWTTGEQQAERYDLSKQINSIHYADQGVDGGGKFLWIIDKSGEPVQDQLVGRVPGARMGRGGDGGDPLIVPDSELENLLGKEIAGKIIGSEGKRLSEFKRQLSGLDLKVGGEGMKGFYDKILPEYANRYAKKWGAKTGTTEIEGKADSTRVFGNEQRAAARAAVERNENLGFDTVSQALSAINQHPDWAERWEVPDPEDREAIEAYRHAITATPVHSIDITPSMRESVMAGQPLFARGESTSSQPVQIRRINSKPFDSRASNQQTAREIGLSYQPPKAGGAPTLWINRQGLVTLQAALGQPVGPENGMTFSPSHSARAANGLDRMAEQPGLRPDAKKALENLGRALRKAADLDGEPRHVAIVDAGPGQTRASIEASYQEEQEHAAQLELTGGNVRGLLPYNKVQTHPLNRKAEAALRAHGYPKAHMALEIAARLTVPGRYQELNLTHAESQTLGKIYAKLIWGEHGEQSRPIIERIAKAQGFPARKATDAGGLQSRGGKPQPPGGSGGSGGRSLASRAGPDQPSESLFDDETEQRVAEDSSRNADQLLGARLTAQLKSGMAMPKKSRKSADKQPDLFAEKNGPEQEPLFSRRMTLSGDKLRRAIEDEGEESSSSKEGPGLWVNPSGQSVMLHGDGGKIATHGTTAMKMTGKKTATDATSDLFGQGYIRLRSNSIEFGKSAGPRAILAAVKTAKEHAEEIGQTFIIVRGHVPQPMNAVVGFNEIGRFASNPVGFLTKQGQRGSVPAQALTAPVAKLAEGIEAVKQYGDEILKLLAPAAREGAEPAAMSVRHRAAELARESARAEAALEAASKILLKLPEDERWAFYDRVERGEVEPDRKLEIIGRIMRALLDQSRKDVQDLGNGKLESFIENYLPHYYKDPEKARKMFADYFAKKPLEGSKSFLKRRKYETLADGMASGLEPISDNPVDMVLLKVREMQKYVMAHQVLKDLKKQGILKFVRASSKMPEGYSRIDDKIATVFGPPFVDLKVAGRPLSRHTGHPVEARIPGTPNPDLPWVTMGKGNVEAGPLPFVQTTVTRRVPIAGTRIMGYFAAPEPAARLVNNYLSPGLREKSSLFRGFLALGNSMNQFQLGFSAFHLGFTSMDAATSGLALGIYQTAHGNPVTGLLNALKSPIELAGVPIGLAAKGLEKAGLKGAEKVAAPFSTMLRGDSVLKEYYREGSQGGDLAAVVDAMLLAGGRARMDKFYLNETTKHMMEAFRTLRTTPGIGGKAGKLYSGTWRVPFAIAEQLSRPIMEYIVPRQKMGVFADMARYELKRLKDASPEEVQAALARAWDSVDNRMGQLVYDNLFWHKIFKDALMASIRSVGWNTGTIRELLGGAADIRKLGAKDGTHWKPDVTTRLSYIIALPFMAAFVGAILQYLYTGEHPRDLKDCFFPRTGRLDKNGQPERVSSPSYVKDVVHYTLEPVRTAQNKIHPLLTTIWEMLENKDYRNKPIRNAEDPVVQQLEEEFGFALKAYTPMAVKGSQQEKDRGASIGAQIPPFFGISPAPSVINRQPKTSAKPLHMKLPRVKR